MIVEKYKFERDSILAEMMSEEGEGGQGKGKARSKDKKGNTAASKTAGAGTGAAARKGFSALLDFSVDLQYKDMLLNPSDRRRGQNRTEFLKKLLES